MAKKKILVDLDLNQNEVQNAVIQNLATAPASPKMGQHYFNTADNTEYVWNGTTWVDALNQGRIYTGGDGINIAGSVVAVDNTVAKKTDIADATLTIQKNGTTVQTFSANQSTNATANITVPVTAADVNALPNTTKYVANASMTINNTTYVVTLQLKDQDGNNIGTAQTIDLPLESVVVSGSYDSTDKKIVLTLQDGSTIDIPVADLVAGLQTEITSTNMLDADLVDDSTSTHKFVTAAQRTQIGTNTSDISTINTTIGGYGDIVTYDASEFVQTGDLGDYVQKSGDTMTGELVLAASNNTTPVLSTSNGNAKFDVLCNSNGYLIIRCWENGFINSGIQLYRGSLLPPDPSAGMLSGYLGSQSLPWGRIYVQSIYNGGELSVPTSTGTLARLEDLPSAEAGTTGQVYTKTASGAEWASLPTGIQKQTSTNPALTTTGGVCTWTITNTLGTTDCIASIREVATNEEVACSVAYNDTSVVVKINSAGNIAANTYKATIIG